MGGYWYHVGSGGGVLLVSCGWWREWWQGSWWWGVISVIWMLEGVGGNWLLVVWVMGVLVSCGWWVVVVGSY